MREINVELSFHADSPFISEVISVGVYKKTNQSSHSEVKLYCLKAVKPCYDFELAVKFTVENSLRHREVYLHIAPS